MEASEADKVLYSTSSTISSNAFKKQYCNEAELAEITIVTFSWVNQEADSKYTGNIWYIRPIETPLDVIPHTIWNTMYCWNHMGYRTALHCYFLTEKHWAQVKFSFTRGQVELRDIKMWCLKQVQKSFLEVWKVTRWVFKCLVGIATSRLTLTKPLLSTLERFSGKQNVLAIIFCILFPPHLNFPFLKEWKRNTFSYISFLILCNAISHCTA